MASSNREAIIQASAKIAALREVLSKAKDDLKKAEAELDRLLSMETPAPSSQATGPVQDQAENTPVAIFTGDQGWVNPSLNQRLVDYLDAQPDQEFESEATFAAFPDENQTSIRSALARLADNQRIRRPRRGRYQSIKGALRTLPEAS